MMKQVLAGACGAAALFMSFGAAAQSESITFDLANDTSYTLTHLYISVPSTNSWEEDILGAQVVGAGETVEVTIDDGLEDCQYDLRADFSDGDSIRVARVNLCESDGETITISE